MAAAETAKTPPPDRRAVNGTYAGLPVPPNELAKESTFRQGDEFLLGKALGLQGAMLWANGGDSKNPMGFPGYDRLYGPSVETYRWMLQHPVLRLVRFVSLAPIFASTWGFKKAKKNVPDEWVTKAEQTFLPIRQKLLKLLSRGMDYGYVTGEPIWEYRDGMWWLRRVKPLAYPITRILRNRRGRIIGLRQSPLGLELGDSLQNNKRADLARRAGGGGVSFQKNGVAPSSGENPDDSDIPPVSIDLPMPFKAWHWSYDGEMDEDDPYGRSWLENCRETSWKDWLDANQQMQRTGTKISGIISVITSPAGTFPGPDGEPVSYQQNAEAAILALAGGAAGIWFPSLGLAPDSKGNIDAMKVLVELAGKSMINVDVKDFGNHAAAIGGFLERIRHAEELMFGARGRSSRVAMEGKHGTKAEAGVHTDSSTTVAEMEDREMAAGAQPLLDADMVLNFGERARGMVLIDPPSLSDRRSDLYRTILLSGLNDPQVCHEVFASANVDAMMRALNIDIKAPFDVNSLRAMVRAAATKPTDAAAKPIGPSGAGIDKNK